MPPAPCKSAYLGIAFSNYRKPKLERNSERSQRGETNFTYRGKKIRITSNFSETVQA